MITLKGFEKFCCERASDGCWNMESAITCIELLRDCFSQPFWKRGRYFKEHYGEAATKFVEETNKEIAEVTKNE